MALSIGTSAQSTECQWPIPTKNKGSFDALQLLWKAMCPVFSKRGEPVKENVVGNPPPCGLLSLVKL
jgi:hypothetical protein